jgi:predicted nucleic acid-binding protein
LNPQFVLDCSIAMTWCFADEATSKTEALLLRLVDEVALVPSLWNLEVVNVLAVAERKKRLSAPASQAFLDQIAKFNLVTDTESAERTLKQLLPLCRAHQLTSYDATYLMLAIERRLPLATLDEDLRRAAKKEKLVLLGK